MFSRILIKLIDQAIIPALFLLSARIISVIGVSEYFGISYDLSSSGFTFSNPNEYIQVNTYSTFFMMLVLIIGLFYILLKAYIFHDTHISPSLSNKLHNLKLATFIQASFDLYSQGTIWLSYTFLLTAVTGIMALFGLVYPWVFVIGMVLSVISTLLLVLDVENEVVIKNTKRASFDTDDLYLEEKNERYA